ncbi:MAG: energy transducer TonB [Terriglobia bacterium]
MVTYAFRHLTLPSYLPVINPSGQLRTPGHEAKPGAHPPLGSSHFDPRITIVSNPPHPDNVRLTITNENPPSDFRPPIDSKVPDLISGGPSLTPEAAKFSLPPPERADNSTPKKPDATPPPKALETRDLAPPLRPAAPFQPSPPRELVSKLFGIPAPHLEVPSPPPAKDATPPAAETAPPPAQPTRQESSHPAAEAPPPQPPDNKSGTASPSDTQKPAGGPKIMALSVDPVPLKDLTAIPAGVTAGAFSISPSGTMQGAPGGAPGAPPDAGKGDQGPAADDPVPAGNGSGSTGGGGQSRSTPTSSASPMISVSGRAGATGISAGTLAPLKAEDLVYPVYPETLKARTPSIVVSSGSWGGGGLRVYGVLHGGKIYTVYFSMPGKNWILQYCTREIPAPVDTASRVVQIHIQPPVAPPAPVELFDFHRPISPPDPANSLIILHGIMHEDGSVSDLAVLQGLDAMSDAAACAAFSRWKFKPAQRAGTPVALEILVGIP